MSAKRVVLDASAAVDLLTGEGDAAWVSGIIRQHELCVPAHFAAEILSAFGRRFRSGASSEVEVSAALGDLGGLPVNTHNVEPLIRGAWSRRDEFRLVDALYVELADQLDTVVVTTDRRLARATALAVAPSK